MFRMAAQVNQSEARAIGTSKDIDLVVSQGGAEFVQVVGSNGGGVLGEVGAFFQFGAAGPQLLQVVEIPDQGLSTVEVFEPALQEVRMPGAALI